MPRNNRKYHAAAGYANEPTQDELTRQAEDSLPQHIRSGTAKELRTTVMWRNIPNNYTQADILERLSEEGFASVIDFLYAPRDMNNNGLYGYAFLNFIDSCYAEAFMEKFHNKFKAWKRPHHGAVHKATEKVSAVQWSEKCQGLSAHVELYRNSILMYRFEDEHLPWVFEDGDRVAFPPPTKVPTKAFKFKTDARPNSRNIIDRKQELSMDHFKHGSLTTSDRQQPSMPDSLPETAPIRQEGVMPAPARPQQAMSAFWQPPAETAHFSLESPAPIWQEGVTPAHTGSQQALPAAPTLVNFCTECGAEFPPRLAKFCAKCGQKRQEMIATQPWQPDPFMLEPSARCMPFYMMQPAQAGA